MCGIAGILYRDPSRPISMEILAAMGQEIAHRGPDGEGFWSGPGVGLVHRRLAIIDLEGGRQPLSNEGGNLQIVFNGEIYNYKELTAWLISRGHTFQTSSDTEVLVHLYEEKGEDLVTRLRGMFAFALWDQPRRRLLLARDRLGIKPLYYYQDAEKLLFSSELKAILAYPGLSLSMDSIALETYLAFGMVIGNGSIFRQVQKLPPAHVLNLDASLWKSNSKKYWQLVFDPDEKPTLDQWKEAIRDKVAESVRLHLIADVPVGAFLSGGIDSSVIVASCVGTLKRDLQTFSMGFQEAKFNELPFARAVANRYKTSHVEQIVTPDSITLLGEISRFFDEPFADSSAIPTFLLAQLTSRHVKVVLSGDGGDEAFGGYSRYSHDLQEDICRQWLPRPVRRTLAPISQLWPKMDWLPRPLRLKTFLTNLSMDSDAAYANTLQRCRLPLRRRLIHPEILRQVESHNVDAVVREAFKAAPRGDPLSGMISADLMTLLPDDYLGKVDRASMACGLEVRPPLLDHELLELTARIPSRWKVNRGETKWIFKQAFLGSLPEEILRKPKQGFEMPINAWLRGPLREHLHEMVLGANNYLEGLIDRKIAKEMVLQHEQGRSHHGEVLWTLLVLNAWGERYFRSRGR